MRATRARSRRSRARICSRRASPRAPARPPTSSCPATRRSPRDASGGGSERGRVGHRAGRPGRCRACSCRPRSIRSPTRPRPSTSWIRSATPPMGRRPARSSGGATAVEFDVREAAAWDSTVIPPIVLVVVFLILMALLRAVVAPLAADRDRDPELPGRARRRLLRLRVHLRLPGLGSVAAAVRLRVPGRAGGRLQHLPRRPRARGDAQTRHPRGHAARPGGHRRGDHERRDRARRHLLRARRAAARLPHRDRLRRGVRRAPRHIPRAERAGARARAQGRAEGVVAVAAGSRRRAAGGGRPARGARRRCRGGRARRKPPAASAVMRSALGATMAPKRR